MCCLITLTIIQQIYFAVNSFLANFLNFFVNSISLVSRIKECGKDKGFSSLSKIETAAGIKPNTIYRWDENAPSVDRVALVASCLDVSVDYLIGATDIKTPAAQGDGLSESDAAILRFLHSLPVDRLRGILLGLGAPEDVLAALDREARQG